MAGISSKALAFGQPENKKKYNGIEKENDLQIEIYDAQLRELDGQTGRWWQIDPEIENMEMWSPYASNYDNPIKYMDPLGDDPDGCCGGFLDAIVEVGKGVVTFAVSAANAFVTNQVGGAGRGDPNSFSGFQKVVAQAGQLYGDYLTMSTAVVVGTISVVAEGGSGGLASPVAIPLLAQQVTAGVTATKNIINDASNRLNSSSNSSSDKYSKLPEPKKVEPGKDFTPAQKRRIIEENKNQNQGVIKSDKSGKAANPAQQSKKGQKADMNQAEVDHVQPKSKGGSNSNSNAQVLTKEENLKKSNKN
jgi:RHS repeat-associated protein